MHDCASILGSNAKGTSCSHGFFCMVYPYITTFIQLNDLTSLNVSMSH